jgi:feruloyl esterase
MRHSTVGIKHALTIRPAIVGWAGLAANALLPGCTDNGTDSAAAALQTPQLSCDESLKAAFKPDADTSVTFVKAFNKGDVLALPDTPAMPPPPTAANAVCMVKLNVGPGNPGPAGAPSTSPGIGIEVWLPLAANWNGKVHVLGGGGWAGGTAISSTTVVGAANAAAVAGGEGAVSAQTDTGHTVGSGSFAVNPDGSINTALWRDFSERAIHQMAIVSKALAHGFYQSDPTYSYWDGCSTGGRQGLKEAQVNPDDFDGILAVAPAINWTKFITAELYPQIVVQRDLAGAPLTTEQVRLVSAAAVNACDSSVSGQHDGYVSDVSGCHYDPAGDLSVICTANGGTNASAGCLTPQQANAVNKIWYGQSMDGSMPAPAADNGFHATLSVNQLWYGVTRGARIGSDLATGGDFGLASSNAGMASPFTIATDQVALNLQDLSLATAMFSNAAGGGADKWKALSYADLARAWNEGVKLQSSFANINTDNPDLTKFRDLGGKLLMAHGLADQLIPPQGSINYYERVSSMMGGLAETRKFFRHFEIPGMAHCGGNGSATGVEGVSPPPNPPLPAPRQLYQVLTDWVEKGEAPESIVVSNADNTSSRPLCMYPTKLSYTGTGDVATAASYTCR